MGIAILAGTLICFDDHVGIRLIIIPAHNMAHMPTSVLAMANCSKKSGSKNQINIGKNTSPAPPGAGTPAKNPLTIRQFWVWE